MHTDCTIPVAASIFADATLYTQRQAEHYAYGFGAVVL